jgi:hypothetical protein
MEPAESPNALPPIGRARALIAALTTAVNRSIGTPPSKATLAQLRRHRVSRIWETRDGCAFDVQLIGPEGDVTGFIVRVTVELDRFEPQR